MTVCAVFIGTIVDHKLAGKWFKSTDYFVFQNDLELVFRIGIEFGSE